MSPCCRKNVDYGYDRKNRKSFIRCSVCGESTSKHISISDAFREWDRKAKKSEHGTQEELE